MAARAPTPETTRGAGQPLAAIDLGSNSFHMVVARANDGQLAVLDRIKEMVQLGAGLDERRNLSAEAQARALATLDRFGQRLRGFPSENVKAVGTNTLRMARNAEGFLEKAEEALGHPIEIVSGIEEARLIYSGVTRSLPPGDSRRLVVDIGGGSTELVVGQKTKPLDLESLYVGCVAMMRLHFPDGKISPKRFRRAEVAALQELERVQKRFRKIGWDVAIGASGTIRAVLSVAQGLERGKGTITRDSLKKLRAAVLSFDDIEHLGLEGLNRARANVFPGGLAILGAVFESLEIDEMRVSDSALREGLLHDLLGRFLHKDVRAATVEALMERYHVDRAQARLVEDTVLELLKQVSSAWTLPKRSVELCSWAARLHEIGLDIAHSHYHKHGAYVLENADMPGFTQQEQRLLAGLVRAHRRKFPGPLFRSLPTKARLVEHLSVLLRLSVLLHRSRTPIDRVTVTAGKRSLDVAFGEGFLEAHPLTQADLQEEADFLKEAGFDLRFPGVRA